ncbi:MAG: pyruvate formate lyase family protein [Armatimonadota bacterium]
MQQVIPADACVARMREGKDLRGSTPRTRRLAMEAVTRDYLPFTEMEELQAATPQVTGVSAMLAETQAFAFVYPRLTPVIQEGELIVGSLLRGEKGPRWNWFPDGDTRYTDLFAQNAPADRPDIRAMAQRGLISPQGSFNHKVVDYANFIRTGSRALIRRAEAEAARRTGEEQEFARAFALGHETMVTHARSYADACETLAETADPERAEELREVARICRKVPEYPAETFHEALQSFWFAYMVAGDGPGRIDVYLHDLYQADLAAGRITPARAQELIECLLIKLHGDLRAGVVNVSSIQTLTLGGLLPDGSDGTNALTRLFLQAIRAVRLLRPSIYLRCHEGMPDDVLELAVEMLGEGLSEPQFFGDKPVVEGLTRVGVPVEVARDYALSGCAEVVSPGRGNWGAPNGWINLALLVDEALREYAASGKTSPECLWATLARHIEIVADACRDNNEWVDRQRTDAHFRATLLMPVCLERCRDINHGGAESYYGHWEGIGLPNATDMLYAVERLGIDAGVPPAELFERLDAGDSALFAQLRALPKFGNDEEGPDRAAARLIEMMADALERRGTPLRKALMLGHLAGGENMHIGYGLRMGPTLDGRAAGQPLADSLAGAQGAQRRGPTALVSSLCRLDHSRLIAGCVSTLQFSPADFATLEARRRVVSLVKTFIALGGSQLQLNVADAETLHRAQESPDAYRGLLVRVAGYSADFTCLGKGLQDEIIARLEGLN